MVFEIIDAITSIIMSFAIVIAIMQLKQPYRKIVSGKVDYILTQETGKIYINIVIHNSGIREVKLRSIYIKGKKVNSTFWDLIQNEQMNASLVFSSPLKPEESKSIYIQNLQFGNALFEIKEKGVAKLNNKLIFGLTDSIGNEYIIKTNYKFKDLIFYKDS